MTGTSRSPWPRRSVRETQAASRHSLFVETTLTYMAQHHPVDYGLLDQAGAASFVEGVIEHASALDVTDRWAWTRLFDLHVLLGFTFMDDPQLAAVLRPAKAERGNGVVRLLWTKTLDYLDVIAGNNGNRYLRALHRADKHPSLMLSGVRWHSADEALATLEHIHPEKYTHIRAIDPSFVTSLFNAARAQLAKAGFMDGVAPIYVVLMFLLGTGFAQDPRYAWARQSLNQGPAYAFESLTQGARNALVVALDRMRRTTIGKQDGLLL